MSADVDKDTKDHIQELRGLLEDLLQKINYLESLEEERRAEIFVQLVLLALSSAELRMEYRNFIVTETAKILHSNKDANFWFSSVQFQFASAQDAKASYDHFKKMLAKEQEVTRKILPASVVAARAPQFSEEAFREPSTSKIDRTRNEEYDSLRTALEDKLKMCENSITFYNDRSDSTLTNLFGKSLLDTKNQLQSLNEKFKNELPLPSSYCTTRTFLVPKYILVIEENCLELLIVRGVNFPPESTAVTDFSSYVKWTFIYPKDQVQDGKTQAVAGTYSPTFNHTSIVKLNLKNPECLESLEHGIDFRVCTKRFLQADKLIGVAHLDLSALKTDAAHRGTIHLTQDAKPAAGELEVRVRIRQPLVSPPDELQLTWFAIN